MLSEADLTLSGEEHDFVLPYGFYRELPAPSQNRSGLSTSSSATRYREITWRPSPTGTLGSPQAKNGSGGSVDSENNAGAE